jgi:hypothetical protein
MKNKLFPLLIVAALIGGGAYLLNSKGQRHAHETGPGMLPVVVESKLLAVGHTRLTQPVVVDIQAVRDSIISSRLLAYVTSLPLFEGGRFKRGDLLARLDMTPGDHGQVNSLNTELTAAESNLKTEQERLRRAQALYAIQGVSQEQLQSAEAAVTAARSRYTVANENLLGTKITAPFGGVVSQRLAQPGDLVTPGKPLLKITDTSAGNRLLVNVPESIQPTGLMVGDQMLPLTLWPEAGPQGLRRYEARSQDGTLLPGSRIDAKLLVFRSPEAVLLPRSCLLNDDGHTATVLALKGESTGDTSAPMPAHQPEHKPAHNPDHQPEPVAQTHNKQGDQPAPDVKAPTEPAGGHHRQAQTAGEIETIKVTLSAQGTEGAVASDTKLAGRRVVCGSPDVLSRLVAGVPFTLQAGKE